MYVKSYISIATTLSIHDIFRRLLTWQNSHETQYRHCLALIQEHLASEDGHY